MTGRVVLVSNRAPISFVERAGRLSGARGAGGVVTALRDLARVAPVTWVAAATASGDLQAAARRIEHGGVFGSGRLAVRPARIARELALHHREFADRVLWFAQHGIWHLRAAPEPAERIRWLLAGYLTASRAFADASVSELHRPGHSGVVLVHDYQLDAVPALIRARLGGVRIGHFTHIPWPRLDVWRKAIPDDVLARLVRSLLAADVVHFQTRASAAAFRSSVEALVPEARVGNEWIALRGRRVLVRARPVSVDPAALQAARPLVERLRADGRALVVRVDRADPIKNVPAGFAAFERLLERRLDLVGRVRFRARVLPTRLSMPEYRRELDEARAAAQRIDRRFGAGTVELLERSDRRQALAELAAADVVLVNSRADGMNLVAKEAAVLNPRLALVLSRRAGAHEELRDGALGIDPDDLEGTAAAIGRGIDMPEAERAERADRMRRKVLRWTSRDWQRALLDDVDEAVETVGWRVDAPKATPVA